MKRSFLVLALLFAATAQAGSPGVYEKSIKQPLNAVYDRVNTAFEEGGFRVVYEVDIGDNLSKIAGKIGKEYNQSQLEGIKSMVFCNGIAANKVGNADPSLLALCPLHVTLIHKAGITSVLFVRPSAVAQGSPALPAAQDLENKVIKLIETGLNAK
ncbi:MAG: DUF302 domain-containing protein [Burkholderiales bacterium]|nr:DUF302 domain-containing protein [Burkholderiales bacterium]